jgi:gliding motility-associated lipoprotein GldH
MNQTVFKTGLLMTCVGILCLACNPNKVYDQYVDLHENTWHVDSIPSFEFEIADHQQSYDIYYNVRYADFYPYYNVYVKYYLEDSAGNAVSSDLQELLLFDKKTGKPLGDGLGDIIDRQILVFDGHKFPMSGKYTMKVKQFMRTEELPGILSFGLRIDREE